MVEPPAPRFLYVYSLLARSIQSTWGIPDSSKAEQGCHSVFKMLARGVRDKLGKMGCQDLDGEDSTVYCCSFIFAMQCLVLSTVVCFSAVLLNYQ